MNLNKIILGECLEEMRKMDDESIDMILCDLPYGTTQCKWDTIIPFNELWKEYNRIIKSNGAIVLTATQPFTSTLVMSNVKMFRYSLVWEKSKSTGYLNSKKMPMRAHEDILVFYKNLPIFYVNYMDIRFY
jgi:site-specific DNA-methyltransferase (adenine-specific)